MECIICTEKISIFCIPACNHTQICHLCTLRMRVLMNDQSCCICKTPSPRVVLSLRPQNQEDIHHTIYDHIWNLHYTDHAILHELQRLRALNCAVCAEENQGSVFEGRNLEDLKAHLKSVHDLYHCEICLKGRKLFVCEQKLYGWRELALHQKNGDLNDPEIVKGHPMCMFCNMRFYDDDELFYHMRDRHYTCHICEANGIHFKYYKNYASLEDHFRYDHFLCEEPVCLETKFVVFKNEIDLKAHEYQFHTDKGRKGKKKAVKLDLDFSYDPFENMGQNSSTTHSNHAQHGVGSSRSRPVGNSGVFSSNNVSFINDKQHAMRKESLATGGDAKKSKPYVPKKKPVVLNAEVNESTDKSSEADNTAQEQGAFTSKWRVINNPNSTQEASVQDTSTVNNAFSRNTTASNDVPTANATVSTNDDNKSAKKKNKKKNKASSNQNKVPALQKLSLSPEELKRRNAALIQRIKKALGNDESKFEKFKSASAKFQKGEMLASEYYIAFIEFFGGKSQQTTEMFMELVQLLPDENKRTALQLAHSISTHKEFGDASSSEDEQEVVMKRMGTTGIQQEAQKAQKQRQPEWPTLSQQEQKKNKQTEPQLDSNGVQINPSWPGRQSGSGKVNFKSSEEFPSLPTTKKKKKKQLSSLEQLEKALENSAGGPLGSSTDTPVANAWLRTSGPPPNSITDPWLAKQPKNKPKPLVMLMRNSKK